MSDPRLDPRLSNRATRRLDGGMWGWIAGIAVLFLIAIILIAGWNSNTDTASNAPPAATTGSATAPVPRSATPPSTTGSAPAAHPAAPPKPATPSGQ